MNDFSIWPGIATSAPLKQKLELSSQVLAKFAHMARSETDLDTLQNELAQFVDRTLQPSSVMVWFQGGESSEDC